MELNEGSSTSRPREDHLRLVILVHQVVDLFGKSENEADLMFADGILTDTRFVRRDRRD
jgi:hypothetical protein